MVRLSVDEVESGLEGALEKILAAATSPPAPLSASEEGAPPEAGVGVR